jgi:membrane protein YdbS with pleckstrin-like domain
VEPLPRSVQRLWRSAAVALAGTVLVVGTIVELSVRRVADPPLPPLVVPLGLGALALVIGWSVATIRYRSWRFELTDQWIQARWGVVTHRTSTIPRNRVQTLTSENGPIDRLLGLTSVTIHTAGSGAPNLSIPHLEDPTVEWLRAELARGPR